MSEKEMKKIDEKGEEKVSGGKRIKSKFSIMKYGAPGFGLSSIPYGGPCVDTSEKPEKPFEPVPQLDESGKPLPLKGKDENK